MCNFISFLKRCGVTSLLVIVFAMSLSAQAYISEFSESKFFIPEDVESVDFPKQGVAEYKLDGSIFFGNSKFDKIYVSNQGWLSFDEKADINRLRSEDNVESLIAPVVSYIGTEIYSGYTVVHKTMNLNNMRCEVFIWKDADLATQAFLFENGDIQIAVKASKNSLKQILETKGNFVFGIIEPGLANGFFPFELPNLKKNEVEYEYFLDGKMLYFKNQYNPLNASNR